MASASSSPWMPTTGRYPAKVGKSLARVIKARKGEPLQKSKFPEPDFYSLRYNFIPPSVDSRKPGTIEIRKGQDTTSVTVERANSQTEEGGHIFVGAETTAKEVECVLIYDEVLQSFTLEKLDSYVNLTYDRKTAKAPRHTGSPHPSSRPSTSASTPSSNAPNHAQQQNVKRLKTADEEFEAELERSLLGEDEDAPGEREDTFADILPPENKKKSAPPKKDTIPTKKDKALTFKKTRAPSPKPIKKEEEEESEPEMPISSTISKGNTTTTIAPKALVKNKKSLAQYTAAKNVNKGTPSPAPSPTHSFTPPIPPTHPLPPKPTSSLGPGPVKPSKTSPKKRDLPPDTPTQPSPTKKAKPSPPPKAAVVSRPPKKEVPKKEPPKKKEPAVIAWPGSEGVALPSDIVKPFGSSQLASTDSIPPVDSEEEDWDLVPQDPLATSNKAKSPQPPVHRIEMEEIIPEPSAPPEPAVEPFGVSHDLVMEEEEGSDEEEYEAVEIDENELQRELEAHFENAEDDEEDADQMEPVEPPQFTGGPVSLNSFAGQLNIDDDDSDDDTTSDESD